MATLTTSQLADLRASAQAKLALPTVTKPTFSTAFQAIEDWFETNRASLAAAIPGGFTAAQKKALVAAWLYQKFQREVES